MSKVTGQDLNADFHTPIIFINFVMRLLKADHNCWRKFIPIAVKYQAV